MYSSICHSEERPLSTETRSEASCSYAPSARKENPLKRKKTDLHEESEPQLVELPKKQRKTETEEDRMRIKKGCAKRQKARERPVKSKYLQQGLVTCEILSEPSCSPRMKVIGNVIDDPEPLPEDLPECFYQRYAVGKQIGRGGFGGVYAGVRRLDGLKVACKYVPMELEACYTPPGETRKLPLEAVLTDFTCKPYCSPYVIKMLEWFETPKGFLYVLERPHKYITLNKLLRCLQGTMSEDMAKIIMWKVVRAVAHCRRSGVIHGDIKGDNILVHPDTLDVKLIDFNCALLIRDRPYKAFGGPPVFLPTAWFASDFILETASIEDLGTLLYKMMCGKLPDYKMATADGLSEACCNLINWCWHRDYTEQQNFEQILEHDWFRDKFPTRRRRRRRRM